MADPEKKPKEELPVLRTLKSDASSYAFKTSFVSAAAQALKRRAHLEAAPAQDRRFLKLALVSGAVLLLAALGGIFYLKERAPAAPETVLFPENLIFPDEKIALKLDSAERDIFISRTRKALYAPLAPGSFRVINFLETKDGRDVPLAVSDFFSVPSLSLPQRLKEQVLLFTLGAVNRLGEVHPFLIFKINSFSESFQEALVWEKTMPSDLRLFFKNIPLPGESGAFFKDRVIKNQDSRVLEEGGKVVLAYAFFNRNLLILTDSDQALGELVTRYAVFPPR